MSARTLWMIAALAISPAALAHDPSAQPLAVPATGTAAERPVLGPTRKEWEKLPSKIRFDPGMTIPPYYTLETRPLTGLMLGGGLMIAAPYLMGMPVAITDSAYFSGNLRPMFIPVVGPFAAIVSFRTPAETSILLMLDGVVQVTGLTLLLLGATTRVDFLERIPFKRLQVAVAPGLDGGQHLLLSGRF